MDVSRQVTIVSRGAGLAVEIRLGQRARIAALDIVLRAVKLLLL